MVAAVPVCGRIRTLGSAHSFTPLIAASSKELAAILSLRRMPRICVLDAAAKRLTVDAGTTYSEVCAFLSSTPFALLNTASLPHFSVAGAVATGTHGSSGLGPDGRLLLSGLADAVVEIELVQPDGEVRRSRRGDIGFDCSVVSLGLLGIAVQLTLQLVDSFDVRQRVYGEWPPPGGAAGSLTAMLDSLPAAMSGTDSFSAFVDWSIDDPGMLILRDFVPLAGEEALSPAPPRWPEGPDGARLRLEPITSFIEGGDFGATGTGRWCDKLHIWMEEAKPFGPQGSAELQFEHFLPLRYATEALGRTRAVAEQWGGALLYSEIRAVRGDEQLLSPYTADVDDGVDSLAITHALRSEIGKRRVLAAAAVLEDALAPLRFRPHWGKLMNRSPADIKALYGNRLERFRQHREAIDPERKFSNTWLDRMLLDE